MAWLQLKIITEPAQAEAIEQTLLDCGALSITYADNADEAILEPALGETPLWRDTAVTALFAADVDTRIINTSLTGIITDYSSYHRWEQMEDKDWTREWMQHYHPIDCGNDLWICPSWRQPPVAKATNVLLDPGLAFGTGTHPTTLLCLEWLAARDLAGLTIIDYGCGSGLLGIAALKRGADKVIAIDIDPQALLATRDNAERNGLAAAKLESYLPDQAPTLAADLVFANILAGPLIALAPTLLAHTRSERWLCLSGILAQQGESVFQAYRADCPTMQQRQRDEWLQLALQKR